LYIFPVELNATRSHPEWQESAGKHTGESTINNCTTLAMLKQFCVTASLQAMGCVTASLQATGCCPALLYPWLIIATNLGSDLLK